MSKEKLNDGGGAFPRPIGHTPNIGASYSESQRGMSLRDYFAAKSIPVVASNHYDLGINCYLSTSNYDAVARDAYAMADAMIEARGK